MPWCTSLKVGIELGVGVRIGNVGREEHRSRHRLQFHVDAGLLRRLLDDLLRLLARLVDRGLIDELQLLAVLGPYAIGALLPARSSSTALALSTLNSTRIVLRAEALGIVQEVGVAMPVRP
jgi:hypothetical protein